MNSRLKTIVALLLMSADVGISQTYDFTIQVTSITSAPEGSSLSVGDTFTSSATLLSGVPVNEQPGLISYGFGSFSVTTNLDGNVFSSSFANLDVEDAMLVNYDFGGFPISFFRGSDGYRIYFFGTQNYAGSPYDYSSVISIVGQDYNYVTSLGVPSIISLNGANLSQCIANVSLPGYQIGGNVISASAIPEPSCYGIVAILGCGIIVFTKKRRNYGSSRNAVGR